MRASQSSNRVCSALVNAVLDWDFVLKMPLKFARFSGKFGHPAPHFDNLE